MTQILLPISQANDDDIFARPPRQEAKRARITCRVCDTKAAVPVDHPALLCPLCLEDLDKTRARVQAWLAATLVRLDQAKAQWSATLERSPARPRWDGVATALAQVADKELDRSILESRWQATLNAGGPMAELLRAYEAYATETDRVGVELARLHKAQAEINTAWLATNDV